MLSFPFFFSSLHLFLLGPWIISPLIIILFCFFSLFIWIFSLLFLIPLPLFFFPLFSLFYFLFCFLFPYWQNSLIVLSLLSFLLFLIISFFPPYLLHPTIFFLPLFVPYGRFNFSILLSRWFTHITFFPLLFLSTLHYVLSVCTIF